jgi:drug/metabolite transporter (DMT)-like permease
MDYLFESTKPTPGQFLGLIFTVVGVLLTANGRMLSEFLDPNYSFDTAFPNYKVQDSLSILIASLVYMVNMMAWAYAVYITKYIRGSSFQINFSFGGILFCASSLIYSINDTHS